jgi:hypothetical protein
MGLLGGYILVPQIILSTIPDGPIITASVAASSALAGSRGAIPIEVRLLLDTESAQSSLDPSVIHRLKLQPTGIISVHTPAMGYAPERMPLFEVALIISIDGATRTFDPLSVREFQRPRQGIDGSIGRDVLSQCLFAYSGAHNACILSI